MPNQRFSKINYSIERKRNVITRFLIKCLEILVRIIVIPQLRIFLYRLMGVKIGSRAFIGMDCLLDSSFPELITIEDEVVISFRVMIICHDHAKGLQSTSTDVADQSVAAVTIQKKAYIGAGAILLPGVIIGENAVVGAGAVVTKDVRPGATVVGIPAKELPAKS